MYYTLASRVAAANPKLKDVKGIVTDSEDPLQNSFLHVFSNAHPPRDFRHFRQNMDITLKDFEFQQRKTELLSSMMYLAIYYVPQGIM